jgi:hypothetical protein
MFAFIQPWSGQSGWPFSPHGPAAAPPLPVAAVAPEADALGAAESVALGVGCAEAVVSGVDAGGAADVATGVDAGALTDVEALGEVPLEGAGLSHAPASAARERTARLRKGTAERRSMAEELTQKREPCVSRC